MLICQKYVLFFMFFALGIAAASFLVPARFSKPCRGCQKNTAESLTIYFHGNGNAILIIKQGKKAKTKVFLLLSVTPLAR